jgi:putative transposase
LEDIITAMERYIEFSIDEFYHIFNRGNDKRNIFLKFSDYERFIKLLFVCNSSKPVVFKTIQGGALDKIDRGEVLVDIGAYCLMPNHFHLLIHEQKEDGISLFMQKLSTAYSMYFNKRHNRTGKLFEGVFRAEYVDKDEYLEYLFAYIHLNPIKLIDPKWREDGIQDMDGAKKYLKEYKYSSYQDYVGEKRPESIILNKEAFPEYFESVKDFDDFITDMMKFDG